MLASITWTQYFLSLLIATFTYCLIIWFIFFKANISFLSDAAFFRGVNLYAEDCPDELLSTTQHIINEIKPLFIDRNNKNELIYALRLELRKYNEWDEPGCREVINAFIASESESKCSISLGEEDRRSLWI